ncbi:helix-turn-helix transcriptional regulator [Candidatus Dactylopiibacterium carminicum]|nr:AraC family transcriptional regulator [Candidatus Dactylopiibacterium carminicum]
MIVVFNERELVLQNHLRTIFPEASKMFAVTNKFSPGRLQPSEADVPAPLFCPATSPQVLAAERRGASTIEAGQLTLARIREGFFLHCSAVTHHDATTLTFPVPNAGLKLILKLEGAGQVSIGGQSLRLDAGCGETARPCGALIHVEPPADFVLEYQPGMREQMIVITLTSAWFASATLDPARFTSHLTWREWLPSEAAADSGRQLFATDILDPLLLGLHQEHHALMLVQEALSATVEDVPFDSRESRQRVWRLRTFLDSGLADTLDMNKIAQTMGCNPTTLQREFREAFATTIFDYLRERRLNRAAEAMRQHGLSVGQAAEIAGYHSQANFSTAFRKHFGFPPSLLRTRTAGPHPGGPAILPVNIQPSQE